MVFNVNSVDIDNDGDFDLISSVIDNDDEVSKITFHKNIGTSVSPNFDNLLNTPSGLIQVVDGYVRAKFVDIDGDGDSDAFFLDAYVAAVYGQSIVYYQENISPVGVTFVEPTSNRNLEKVVDVLGREVNQTKNQILFHIYDDGSVEKKFIVE